MYIGIYGTVRYGTVRYGTVCYGTVRYGTGIVLYILTYCFNIIFIIFYTDSGSTRRTAGGPEKLRSGPKTGRKK